MKKNPELKPCPFCGGKSEISDDLIMEMVIIACMNKKCYFHFYSFDAKGFRDTKDKAIKKYNRRVK